MMIDHKGHAPRMRGRKVRGQGGLILISVLWVVLFMSVLAWGLSRRSALEISLLETYQGRQRSTLAARGGINAVLAMLSAGPTLKDTLYATGIKIDRGQNPQEIFSHIEVGHRAYAMVQWNPKGFGESLANPVYGLSDEQAKININAINQDNFRILSALLKVKDVPVNLADRLAQAIVGFKGTGTQPGQANWLDDDGKPAIKPKNRPFEHINELLYVPGMTREIFDHIKDDVTVYGDPQNGLWVNMNTANDQVVQALVNAAQEANKSVNATEIEQYVKANRNGADGRPFTEDDGQAIAQNILNWPPALREGKSMYVRARVVGVDKDSGMHTTIEAVIRRVPGTTANEIISWQRN